MIRQLLSTLSFALVSQSFALTVSIFQELPATCSYPTGVLGVNISGGVGPYTILWSTGASTSSIADLVAGTYSVTVTDDLGAQETASFDLVAQNYPDQFDYQHVYCPGQVYHSFFNPQAPDGQIWDPQFGPYTTSVGAPVEVNPGWPGYYYLVPGVPDGQTFLITYWDVNGCQGDLYGTAGYLVQWPMMSILTVEPSCENVWNGSVTFTTNGEGNGMSLMYQVLGEDGFPIFTNPVVTADTGTYTFENLPPGDLTLTVCTMNTPSSVQQGLCYTTTPIPFTLPSAGSNCGGVSGYAFIDLDADCIIDGNEPELNDLVLEFQPGPYYAGSSYGYYNAVLPFGTYTVTSNAPTATLDCPATFTLDGANTYEQLNLGHTSTLAMDVGIGGGTGPARPGFILNQSITIANNSAQSTGLVTVTMQFDPIVSYVSATPPASVAGTTLTWVRPAVPAFDDELITIQFQVPPDIGLLGTQFTHTATATPQNPEVNTLNNTDTYFMTITGAVDPNDKLARTSTGESNALYFINEDEWVDYTIRFQNTGTDTAFNVVVTDTLPATLDLATLDVQSASHPFYWSLSGRTLRAVFQNILLPDSNTNEPRSHGHIAFRIEPMQPLTVGTVIENIANIFFDFNPPVITEPSVLVAEFSTGVQAQAQGPFDSAQGLRLLPNPASDHLRVSIADGSIEEITILAADGREVMRRALRSSNATLDVSTLRAGSYFLLATLNTGSTVRVRFIKL